MFSRLYMWQLTIGRQTFGCFFKDFKYRSKINGFSVIPHTSAILTCLIIAFTSGCVTLDDWVHDEFVRHETIQKTQTINIRSEPIGAKVWINEQLVGSTPISVPIIYNEVYSVSKRVTDRHNDPYHYAWSSNTKTYTRISEGPEQSRLDQIQTVAVKIDCFLDGYEQYRNVVQIPSEKNDYLFILNRKTSPDESVRRGEQQQQQQQQTIIINR